MSNETERKENESYASFMKRIVAMAADKCISYTKMGDALFGNKNRYGEENLRKIFYGLNIVCNELENDVVVRDSDVLSEIKEQRRLLEETKVQLRDERVAYNAQNRNSARFEQKLEYLGEVLSEIGGERFSLCVIPDADGDNDLLVVLSDLHIGAEFYSMFGMYNSEMARDRLKAYLNEIITIQKRHKSKNVYVVLAGDLINGSIHKAIAITNRENVIDQVKLAAEYIGEFCYNLSMNFANVYFTDVAGNHSRIDRKEDALHDERLDNLISWIVSKLLAGVSNFKSLEDGKFDTGIASFNIRDKLYIAVHGDYDGASRGAVSRLVQMLGYTPYAIVMGHRHYPAVTDESGVRVVQGGSLCGSGDDYTIEKRLNGKPSQTVCVCTDKGIECVYPIVFE